MRITINGRIVFGYVAVSAILILPIQGHHLASSLLPFSGVLIVFIVSVVPVPDVYSLVLYSLRAVVNGSLSF